MYRGSREISENSGIPRSPRISVPVSMNVPFNMMEMNMSQSLSSPWPFPFLPPPFHASSTSTSTQHHYAQQNVPPVNLQRQSKSAGWSEKETKDLLFLWGARFEKLKASSVKVRNHLWNEIYQEFMEMNPGCGRTLPEIKERQQNLEYEFKLLKRKVHEIGEEVLLKINRSFPYYDIMDDVLGHQNNIDLDNMELEGSSVFVLPSPSPAMPPGQNAQFEPLLDDQLDPLNDSEEPATTGGARKKDARARKRKRDDVNAAESDDFKRMWQQSMEAEEQRFERCMAMQQEMQRQQMEQSMALLSGFKDLFKEILKKD